jgi:hypothetical protein
LSEFSSFITPRKAAGAALILLAAGCSSSKPSNAEGSPSASASSRVATTQAPPTSPPKTYKEVQQFGAPTFGDYEHAAEPGIKIPLGATVEVNCVEHGPVEAAPSTKGSWYHLTGPEPYGTGNNLYAATNTFWNQDTKPTGPLSEQLAVDPRVPNCDPADLTLPRGTLPLALLSPGVLSESRPAA